MPFRDSFQTTSVSDNPADDFSDNPVSSQVQFPVTGVPEETIRSDAWKLALLCFVMAAIGSLPLVRLAGPADDSAWADLIYHYTKDIPHVWSWITVLAAIFIPPMVLDNFSAKSNTLLMRIVATALAVGAAFAWIHLKFNYPGWLTAGAVYFVLSHACRFRENFLHLVSTGFYDKETRDAFRKKRKLPAHIKPGPPGDGFLEAWALWASYNRDERQHPSFAQSPGGPIVLRWVEAAVMSAGMGHIISYHFFYDWPSWTWPLETTGGGIWTTGLLLAGVFAIWAVVPITAYFTILAIVCGDVLGPGMGMKKSAFDAQNSEMLYRSLEEQKR